MTQVITITSGKGGVGKTTTTANLGVALALRGKRVACVDSDIGLRNLDVVLGLENRIVYDIVDVVEGRARLKQALIKDKRLPDLMLLPAAQTRDKSAVNPTQMSRLIEELKKEADYILIDSPAGIEQGFRNALAPANLILLVTTPEVSAVRDADRIIGMVEAAEKKPPRLILNRIRPALVRRGEMMDTADVLEILSIELIGQVPEDESIITSTNRGQPVAFDGNTPAGVEYGRIAERLLGKDVPFRVLNDGAGWMERVRGLFRRDQRGAS